MRAHSCKQGARLENTRQLRARSQPAKPASGSVMVDVVVNGPAFGIGLDALLQNENAGRRFLWGHWLGRREFLIGQVNQRCFQGQAAGGRFGSERNGLLGISSTCHGWVLEGSFFWRISSRSGISTRIDVMLLKTWRMARSPPRAVRRMGGILVSNSWKWDLRGSVHHIKLT